MCALNPLRLARRSDLGWTFRGGVALAGVLLAVFVAVLPARAGTKLRIATEGAYAPFNYVDAAGALTGFDVDIAKALCQVMEAECSFVVTPWDRIIEGLEAGEYDAIVASMSYTPARAARVEFTKRYYRTTSSYIVRREAAFDPKPEALKGKRIATQAATVHADYLNATYGGDIALVLDPTLEEALDRLIAGEAEAVLCNTLAGLGFLRGPKGAPLAYAGEPLSEKNLSSTANIAVRKGEARLRDRLDKALETIRLNGEYDRINQKYFPFSIY